MPSKNMTEQQQLEVEYFIKYDITQQPPNYVEREVIMSWASHLCSKDRPQYLRNWSVFQSPMACIIKGEQPF